MNKLASRFALLGLALGVASLAPAVFAQASGTAAGSDSMMRRAPDPQRQATRLAKHLGLSDDQTAKLTTILQNRAQQLAAVRNDSSLAPQDRHAKLRSIQQDADTQINAVLTPDQQKEYATLKQNMRQRWQNAHNGGGSDNGSD